MLAGSGGKQLKLLNRAKIQSWQKCGYFLFLLLIPHASEHFLPEVKYAPFCI
jgi:hypothetical protein